MHLHELISRIPVLLYRDNHNRRENENQAEEEEAADGLNDFSVGFKGDLIERNKAAYTDE